MNTARDAPLDATVEAQFVQRRARMLARASHSNLLFIAAGLLVFCGWDFWLDPLRAPITLAIRGAGTALILLLIGLLRRGVDHMKVKYVYGGAFLIATLTVGLSTVVLDQGVLFGTAGIVAFPAVLAFYSIPIRLYVLLVGLALALLLPVMMWFAIESGVIGNFVVYYALLAWIGYIAAHMLRRQQLRVFRLELRHAEEARTDALTGLFNRRLILELGEREVERARRDGGSLCVGMLDLDHFKRVNDSHGHVLGDRVLQLAAQTLAGALRQSDVLARFGGEEFVLLLVGTDLDAARQVGMRALAALRTARLPELPQLAITASLGLAELGRSGHDWTALLNAADQALLRAKLEGRDRVVTAL